MVPEHAKTHTAGSEVLKLFQLDSKPEFGIVYISEICRYCMYCTYSSLKYSHNDIVNCIITSLTQKSFCHCEHASLPCYWFMATLSEGMILEVQLKLFVQWRLCSSKEDLMMALSYLWINGYTVSILTLMHNKGAQTPT